MSVHKKLMQARVDLQATQMKKSGLNKFAGYSYFTLDDFLPPIQAIFNKVGLCGVISFTPEVASLTITDVDDGTTIVITSPMAEANLKGTHPIQNLGAVETYQRRYLWVTAMEIVEHDVLDSSAPLEDAPKPAPRAPVKAPAKIEGKDMPWKLKVTAEPEDITPSAWGDLVVDMTLAGLNAAASEADVMSIFKVNRNIFDKLKEIDPENYDAVMEKFKTFKAKFKAAA